MYTRWTAKETTQKLRDNKEEILEKMRTLEIKNKTDDEKIKLKEYKQIEEKTNKRIKGKKR